MLNDKKLYDIGVVSSKALGALKRTFSELPDDDYAEKRLRSRAYSCFVLQEDGQIQRHTHKEFMQTEDINDYLGGVHRQYEEISDEVMNNEAFVEMFTEFQDKTGLKPGSIVEAHQIRWQCKRNVKIPAPEGNHQDGFDFIAMFAVNAENVDGGDLMLFEEKEGAPIFKRRLSSGEFMIVNDRKLFHNAAPLVPTANEDDGYWDLIVLTANKEDIQSSEAA